MSARKPIATVRARPRRSPELHRGRAGAAVAAGRARSVPAPAPPARPWRRLLVLGGGAFLFALLGVEAYDFLVDLFERPRRCWAGRSACSWRLAAVGALGLAASEILTCAGCARAERPAPPRDRIDGSELHGEAEPLLGSVEGVYRVRRPTCQPLHRAVQCPGHDAMSDGERCACSRAGAGADRQACLSAGAEERRDIAAAHRAEPAGPARRRAGAVAHQRPVPRDRPPLRHAAGLAATVSLLRRARATRRWRASPRWSPTPRSRARRTLLVDALGPRRPGCRQRLLAARLGIEAIRQCRPLPFCRGQLPSLKQLRKALFE